MQLLLTSLSFSENSLCACLFCCLVTAWLSFSFNFLLSSYTHSRLLEKLTLDSSAYFNPFMSFLFHGLPSCVFSVYCLTFVSFIWISAPLVWTANYIQLQYISRYLFPNINLFNFHLYQLSLRTVRQHYRQEKTHIASINVLKITRHLSLVFIRAWHKWEQMVQKFPEIPVKARKREYLKRYYLFSENVTPG